MKYRQPQIERLVARQISAPIRSFITGQPSIDRAQRDAVLFNLRRQALIAIGIVFVLLLVGLRAPVAAAVVAAVAAFSTLASLGAVTLLGHVLTLDPVGVAVGTMLGLALGVGFALLVLDRFRREQLPPGAPPRTAAVAGLRGLERTGRAVVTAGSALALGLVLVGIFGPSQLMVSVGLAR